MLNDNKMAMVTSRLQVPLIVSDILRNEEELTDDVHYALHEIISDMQPDCALLSIALSALKIANSYHKSSPSLAVLKLQCESIIHDYAEIWLQNAEDENVEEHEAMDALSCVSEDLEGLGELLELAIISLQGENPVASSLAKILSIQAGSHAMIADELFGALYAEIGGDTTEDMGKTPDMASVIADNNKMFNNVIPFRAKRA